MERASSSSRSRRARSPGARTQPALKQSVAVDWLSRGRGPSSMDFTTNATNDLRAAASYSSDPTTTDTHWPS